MSEQATVTPASLVITATKPMQQAWAKVLAKEGELVVLRDKFALTAKSATTEQSWNQKQLTQALLGLNGMDAARASELVGWVFPKNAENRKVLDEIIEKNSQVASPHDRIGKPVQLAIQRSAEPLTIAEATKQVEAAKEAKKQRAARPPGGPASPTTPTTPTAPLTAKEQSDRVQDAIVAAAKLAKSYGFDETDFQQEVEGALLRFKPFGEKEEPKAE